MFSIKPLFVVFILLISVCQPAQALSQQWFSPSDNFDIQTLSEIYPNDTHFIWLKNQQLTVHAFDALDFIASAPRHGLNANKYHLSKLNKLDPRQDLPSAKRFEFLLSDGLLKFISDLKVGQFEASVVDPDWFIPQATFNAVNFLQQAILQKHLKDELNSLIPNTDEYRLLTQTLAQYQSYAARGTWKTIPTSPLLRVGTRHPNIALLRARLAYEDPFLSLSTKQKATKYDEILEQAVRNFQRKHSLKVDGLVGKDTINAMNISAQDRVKQIQIALERRRWMPKELGARYLKINLASYQLSAIENGEEKLAMRVIVGHKKRQTPSFTANMRNLVFNPYWNVPEKLARLDLLPKQQANLNYFYSNDIRVFTREEGRKIEHNTYSIDWKSVSHLNFPYILRQDPGEHNALGRIKFMFKNPWGIYLHDTSHRALFSKDKRSLSSGCIRVADPIGLANFSLSNTPEEKILDLLESDENKGLMVDNLLTIYAVYFTVSIEQNRVRFSPDIYQRDYRIAKLL